MGGRIFIPPLLPSLLAGGRVSSLHRSPLLGLSVLVLRFYLLGVLAHCLY